MTVLSNVLTRANKGSALSHTEMDNNLTTLASSIDGAMGEGNKILFLASAAPTGWTQDTTATLSNAGLRIVTGTGAGTGGSANWVASLTITDGTTLTAAQSGLPAHNHLGSTWISPHKAATGSSGGVVEASSSAVTGTNTAASASEAHTHAITWAPKYVDFIVCSKDTYS